MQDAQAGRPAIKSHPVRACGPASPQKSVIRLSARRFFGARAQGPRMAYKTCYLVQFSGVNLGGIGAALIGCAPFQPYFCPAALRPLSRLAALGTAAPKPGSKRSPAACPLAAQRAARGLAPSASGLRGPRLRAGGSGGRTSPPPRPPASRRGGRYPRSLSAPPGSPGNGEGRRGGSVLSILSSTPGYVNSQLLFLLTFRKICGMISLQCGVAPPICCGYL